MSLLSKDMLYVLKGLIVKYVCYQHVPNHD